MKKGAKRAGREGAKDVLAARLVEVLGSAEFQMSVIQRLVAASMNAADGHLVVELAVDRVWEERGSPDSLAGRLMREVEAGCARYADLRGLPYRKVVGPIIRGWPVLMRAAREAGLTREEGYAVMRDLLRKIPASHWSGVKDIDRALREELCYGFRVVGFGKGGGIEPGDG